ncbi:MAG: NAD(P)/FAD-dependent oxidoreductase, partial [Pseudomonadota bacterium]
ADGEPVPGIAPAAKQQGRYVAKVIRARLTGAAPPRGFRYRHAGNLATIGRRSAVAEFGRLRLKGRLAWWIWGVAHIYFLIGLSSPLIVSIRWLWQYLTYGRGARLITGTRVEADGT